MLLKDTLDASVIADKSYDAQVRVIELLYQASKAIVIPLKTWRWHQRSYDLHLYKMRHLIKNFFARLMQYRAIATRLDKMARNFLGTIRLAASVA